MSQTSTPATPTRNYTPPRTPGAAGSGSPEIYRALSETLTASVCPGPARQGPLPCSSQCPLALQTESLRSGLCTSCWKPGVPCSALGAQSQSALARPCRVARWEAALRASGPACFHFEGLRRGSCPPPQGLPQRDSGGLRKPRQGSSSVWAHRVSFSLPNLTSSLPLHASRGSCPVRRELEDSVPSVLPPQLL